MGWEIAGRADFASANEFQVMDNGYLHCKNVPYYIFALAVEGHYELEIAGQYVICEEGGAFFTPPGVPLKIWHFVGKSHKMCVRYVHFRVIDNGHDPFAERPLPPALDAQACQLPGELLKELLQSGEPFRQQSLFWRIIAELYRLAVPVELPPIPEYLQKVGTLIGQYADGEIAIRQLCKSSGCSRSKLYADFFRCFGVPPQKYITQKRILYAAGLLLREPGLSIKEIAAAAGWKTPYHFSRVFKEIMGESPLVYRRNVRY